MKKEFLYKVLNQIISEIRIDYDDQETYTPFIKNEIAFISYYNPNDHFKSIFSEHCRNVYGLGRGEIMILWRLFLNEMKNKIGRMDGLGNINESTDIDKKFLDRVTDQIVDETKIDYDQEILYTPFELPFSVSPISAIFIHISLVSFFTHCEEVYGLTYNELEYVWKKYVFIIGNEIESKDNLNEARISSKSNTDYLDEVAQYLIDNTVIIPDKTMSVSHEKSKTGKIIIPVKDSIELKYYYNTLLNPSIVLLFSDEMENVYGLDPGLEIKYVWDKYKKHIFSNI